MRVTGTYTRSSTTEFKFNSKQEAEQAVAALERVSAADMSLASDPAQALTPASPIGKSGFADPALAQRAGVTDAESRLLADRVTASEVSDSFTAAGSVELRMSGQGSLFGQSGPLISPPGGAGGTQVKSGLGVKAGEGALAMTESTWTTGRRVDYATDVKAGKVTETESLGTQATGRLRDVGNAVRVKSNPGSTIFPGRNSTAQARDEATVELYASTLSVSASKPLAPGASTAAADAQLTDGMPIDGPRTVTETVTQPQGPARFNPVDRPPFGGIGSGTSTSQSYEVNKTTRSFELAAADAPSGWLGLAAAGDLSRSASATPQTTRADQFARRVDVDLQVGRATAGRAGALEIGGSNITRLDDYPGGQGPVVPPTTPAAQPPHLQVQSDNGANLRETPSANSRRLATVRPGSYLDGTGPVARDDQNREWVRVTGFDQSGAQREGWVRGDLIVPYDPAGGQSGPRGRYLPGARDAVRPLIARSGDSLWSISQREQVAYDQVLARNPQLRDRSLIFEGDTIYVPAR